MFKSVRDALFTSEYVINKSYLGGVNSDGQPIVVEIDKSKFGKRKYNKGKRVDGVWVVGGVERKVFLLTVPNRNQNTLKLIIDTFVKDGND
jgi:hypothetical protein